MALVPATTDPRIDAYIAKAATYAQPILIELRARVHSACPEVVETIKWRAPSFEHHGFLGGFAAFKNYCSFMFWQEQPLTAEGPKIQAVIEQCAKITTVQDLPGKVAFRKVIKLAMKRNEAGQQQKRVPKNKPAKLHMPEASGSSTPSATAPATGGSCRQSSGCATASIATGNTRAASRDAGYWIVIVTGESLGTIWKSGDFFRLWLTRAS